MNTDVRNFKKRTTTADLAHIDGISRSVAQVQQNQVSAKIPAVFVQNDDSKYRTVVALVSDLIENPLNARRLVSTAGIEDLGEQMAQQGQTTACIGYYDEMGRICLIDGHRRLEGAKHAGIKELRVEIRPKPESDQELYLASRSANTYRENHSPLDDALAWNMLLDKGVFLNQTELARKIGVDETVMSRIRGLAVMPRIVISMLSERPDLLSNARMLFAIKLFADACGEAKTEELIIEIERDGLSSREVDRRRVAFAKTPVSRKRSQPLEKTYSRGNASIKRFEGQGRLVLELSKVANEQDVEILQEKILQAIASVLDEQQSV